MRRLIAGIVLAAAVSLPAAAALKVGDAAPDFTTQASLGGGTFSFHLKDALRHGPVVLYFYPAAFTTGCTFEAHAFAESVDRFKALGATVIGVSHDDIATLQRFSVSECRSKFPVASDADHKIMTAYDSVLAKNPQYANRTSYVIAPDGKIIFEFTDMNWEHHVENTMAAVQKWHDEHPGH